MAARRVALAAVLGLAAPAAAQATDPWGRPDHLRAVAARPVDWQDRGAAAPVRLWWDADGGPGTVAVQVRGRWRVVAASAAPGWISPPLPPGTPLRLRLAGAARWSAPVTAGPWQDGDSLATLGGWDGGADVVGEVVVGPEGARVLASSVGGGLWVHGPGAAPERLGRWEGLPDARALAVDMRDDGAIVVGTAAGAARLGPELAVEAVIDTDDGLPSAWVQSVRFEGDARLWLGTYEGLAWQEAGALVTELAPWSVFSLAVHPAGGVWAGYEGLRWVRPGQAPELWLEDAHVYGILVDGDTLGLATTEHGLLWMDGPGSGRRVGPPGARFGVVQGPSGRWEAAGPDGLRGPGGLQLGRRSGLPADGVRAVAQAPDGRLWVGTDGGLATVLPGASGPRVHAWAAGFPAVVAVRGLSAGPDGLWMATDRGLHRLGRPAGGHGDDLVVAIGENDVQAVVHGPEGSVALGARLVRLDPRGRLRAWTPPAGLVAAARAGDQLYVGGPEGLWVLRDDALVPTSGLRDVRALAADARGLWVISGVNLFRVVGGTVAPYLRSHPPLAVASAPDGAWLGTTDGLERIHLGGDDPGGVDDVLGAADAGVAVPAVAADGTGGCWFAAADGTVGHVSADGRVRTARLPGPDAPAPTAIAADGPAAAWVGTSTGLLRLQW